MAGNEGCGTRTDRAFLENMCFPHAWGKPCRRISKTDKIDCQSPRAKLEIGKLRSPVLTGRHKQRHYLALAQKTKRALKHVNGVLSKARRGAFWKSVQRKL